MKELGYRSTGSGRAVVVLVCPKFHAFDVRGMTPLADDDDRGVAWAFAISEGQCPTCAPPVFNDAAFAFFEAAWDAPGD